MLNRRKKILFCSIVVISSTLVALCFCEIALRVIGFEFSLYPTRVQFGWPDPITLMDQYIMDEELLWVPENYYATVDSWRGRKPSIVFMGDSCTEFGRYDELFERIIGEKIPDNHLDFVNVGVGGWSSYQGLLQLSRDILPMSPRVVTVYYGWNDHWTSFGIEDKVIGKFNLDHSVAAHTIYRLRVVQLVNYFRIAQTQQAGNERRPERVSPQDFGRNLAEMIRVARDNDIVPVLITAPSSHTTGSEPAYLAERWLNDLGELIPVHQEYAEIVREVASEYDVLLVDLLTEFDLLPEEDVKNTYFTKDGIHLTPEGNRLIAYVLYDVFEENRLLELITE